MEKAIEEVTRGVFGWQADTVLLFGFRYFHTGRLQGGSGIDIQHGILRAPRTGVVVHQDRERPKLEGAFVVLKVAGYGQDLLLDVVFVLDDKASLCPGREVVHHLCDVGDRQADKFPAREGIDGRDSYEGVALSAYGELVPGGLVHEVWGSPRVSLDLGGHGLSDPGLCVRDPGLCGLPGPVDASAQGDADDHEAHEEETGEGRENLGVALELAVPLDELDSGARGDIPVPVGQLARALLVIGQVTL